jgi:penicillin G amidase
MRKLVIALVALIALVVLVAVGGVWFIKRARPDYDAVVTHARVTRDVDVWRDSAGVPHVWAQSTSDMLFAQGYLHAQERLWQMELFRRVGEGRLSEVFGASMISTDEFFRTLGIWQAAALNARQLDAGQRQLLDAYVAGVNHWIDTHDGPLPPEFVTLRIRPEHWTPQHSLAIEKIMSWDLAVYSTAASLTRAARALRPDQLKYLVPADPSWGTTIIEAPQVPQIPPAALTLLDALSTARASNAWVIGGTRTRSGKPILANDMHLMLRQPGVWYLMALHAADVDVVGMTLPGVPNVVAGHNRAVAWGFTNVMMDDIDLFEERLDAKDAGRYMTPTGSEPFTTRAERLRVKGRDSAVVFTIRTTRHGPVLSDVDEKLRGRAISVQWAALDTSRSFQAFYSLNRARNADEVRRAVRDFNNPHQNVVYADTAGNFGYQMGGRIPIRGDRKRPPLLPVPGWTGEWDWRGYLPFEEHPATHNPINGYVVTANNRQVRGGVGDLIGSDWDMPYRAARITEMVRTDNPHDAASVHRMQLDVKDLLAVKYKEYAAATARAAARPLVARLLEEWDGTAGRDSRAAPYFYIWYEHLRRQVPRTLYGSQGGYFTREAMNMVLDSARILWAGARGAEELDSLAVASMLHADSVVRGKSWGELHQVVAVHVLAEAPALEKLLNLNVGPAPHQGAPTTVNVAQYIGNTVPIRTSYGPSERHVVDMANVDGAGGFILPTGQSGLPGSPHYGDMFNRWRNGGLWLIPLDRAAAQARTVHRMRISAQ